MIPLLTIMGKRDVCAILTIDGVLEGAWRGETIKWVLEAYKPLVVEGRMSIEIKSPKASKLWQKTKTAKEVLKKLGIESKV